MPGILAVTDGTIRVELKNGPLYIDNWTPAVPGPKNGGVWRNSPLADGRQLAFRRFEHVTDSFQLNISTDAMDDTILVTRNLRTLLEKAVSYWTAEWQNEPVWIEVRGSCETENRYALIYDYRTPNDDDPFKKPFHNVPAAIEAFTLLLEHGPWLALPPGQGECVEISAQSANQYPYHLEFAGGTATDNVDCLSAAAIDDLTAGAFGFTAEAWVRADGYGGTNAGRIFGKGQWNFTINSAFGLYAEITAATHAVSYSGLDEFTADGQWHHVAMTYDDGGDRKIRLWIDGTQVTSYGLQQAVAGALTSDAGNNLYLGNDVGLALCWDGGIGWCRLSPFVRYTVAFTPPPRCFIPMDDGNTVAIWICEGSGVTAYNQMGTAGTDGTITGATWDGDCTTEFGREAVCAVVGATDSVFVSNQRGGQLTHVFWWDDSAGIWSGNIIGTVPAQLLPNPMAVDDLLYFGCNIPSPFCSLVLNVGVISNTLTTAAWEYWNGGAWAAIPGFTASLGSLLLATTGITVFYFLPPAAWATTNILGSGQCYFVRCRVIAVGGIASPPWQTLRRIYTVNTPYVEMDNTAVLGDIPALADGYFYERIKPTLNFYTRFFWGERGVDRGDDFTAYINLADICNPIGINVTVTGIAAFATSPLMPSGRYITYSPPGIRVMGDEIVITFSSNIVSQYYGKFRLLIRTLQTGGGASGDFSSQYSLLIGGINNLITYGRAKIIVSPGAGINAPGLSDLGTISILPSENLTFEQIILKIRLACSSGAPGVLNLMDVILIPTDELSVDCTGPVTAGASLTSSMVIESIGKPKEQIAHSYTILNSTGNKNQIWRTTTSTSLQIPNNTNIRIWFLSATDNGVIGFNSDFMRGQAVYLRKVERYLSMRGDQ